MKTLTRSYAIGVICSVAVFTFATTSAFAEGKYISNQTGRSGTHTGDFSDPYDGSTSALFTSVMNSIPKNTTINLVGTNTVNAFSVQSAEHWQLKSGQRLLGQGMY